MTNFKIALEIEIEAETALEAAKILHSWEQDPGNEWQYYVQNTETDEIFSVDLSEEDEDAVLPVMTYSPLIYT